MVLKGEQQRLADDEWRLSEWRLSKRQLSAAALLWMGGWVAELCRLLCR